MYRKLLFVILATCSFSAFGHISQAYHHPNFQAGPYIGIQGGFAKADEGQGLKLATNDGSPDSVSIEDGGFGGRAYGGWSVNPYFSLEAGVTDMPDNNYSATINEATTSYEISTYAIDFMAKIILPLGNTRAEWDGWDIYGKGGIAYVFNKLTQGAGKMSHSAVRPTVGFGVGYNFDDSLSVDASWTGIFGKDKIGFDSGLTNIGKFCSTTNLFALGVTFKFVDL